jgi:hypothetical protein
LGSYRFEFALIASTDCLQPKLVGGLEKMADLLESIGMYFCNEAGSDHGHIQDLFAHGIPVASKAENNKKQPCRGFQYQPFQRRF